MYCDHTKMGHIDCCLSLSIGRVVMLNLRLRAHILGKSWGETSL